MIKIKKFIIYRLKIKCIYFVNILILMFNRIVLANGREDPFPKLDIQGGDVIRAVGSRMEMSMRIRYDWWRNYYDVGGNRSNYASACVKMLQTEKRVAS